MKALPLTSSLNWRRRAKTVLKLNTSTQFKKDYKNLASSGIIKWIYCRRLLMYCECLTHCHKRTETTA